jgi:hypothetical protein
MMVQWHELEVFANTVSLSGLMRLMWFILLNLCMI